MGSLWARDAGDVARRLLARDGAEHIELVGERAGFKFSVAWCHRECMEDKGPRGFLVEFAAWGEDPLYAQVHGWGGGEPLYFVMHGREIPPGEVHEQVDIRGGMWREDGEPLAVPDGTPLVTQRTFTFEELGL
jgi:hypothetical protein